MKKSIAKCQYFIFNVIWPLNSIPLFGSENNTRMDHDIMTSDNGQYCSTFPGCNFVFLFILDPYLNIDTYILNSGNILMPSVLYGNSLYDFEFHTIFIYSKYTVFVPTVFVLSNIAWKRKFIQILIFSLLLYVKLHVTCLTFFY